jgi:hypothetical protein
MLSSGEYADFEIRCGTYTFKVHRVMLAAFCKYFHKMFKSNMTETMAGFATFPDEEPHIIARLLQYLYTSDYFAYDEAGSLEISQFANTVDPHTQKYGDWSADYDRLALEVKLFAAADRYGVAAMKLLSKSRFLRHYIALLQRQDDEPTTDDLVKFSQVFIDLTQMIYATTPSGEKGLRDIMVKTMQRSMGIRRFLEVYGKLITKEPDFTYDLATRRLDRQPWKCAECAAQNVVLLTFCTKDRQWDCRETACQEETVQRNHCHSCETFGSVRRPGPSDYPVDFP